MHPRDDGRYRSLGDLLEGLDELEIPASDVRLERAAGLKALPEGEDG